MGLEDGHGIGGIGSLRRGPVDAKDWWLARGPVASTARRLRVVSTVAGPIVVEDRLWDALTISSTERLLPVDSEARPEKFTAFVELSLAASGWSDPAHDS
jgi:hypothetical protein